MAKEGVLPTRTDMFGLGGQAQLDDMKLGDCYRIRIDSLRDLIDSFSDEVEALEALIHDVLKDHAGYRAVQAIDGVGHTFAAIFVAEIGDVTRFPGPAQLCSWAGLTPRHFESDTTVHRGPVTKQGSPLLQRTWVNLDRSAARFRTPEGLHEVARLRQGTAWCIISCTNGGEAAVTIVFDTNGDGRRCMQSSSAGAQ